MALTIKQYAYLNKRKQKKMDKVLNNNGSFQLSDHTVRSYFQVDNGTNYEPLCYIKHMVDDETAHVEAIFFGSGMVSHPVHYANVPVAAIKSNIDTPMWLLLLMHFKNWIVKPDASESAKN